MYVMKKFFKTKAVQAALAKYPKLTLDGACAIYLFTCESPLYRQLNQKLRERDRTALKEGFFPYARLLFEAHQAMRSTKPRMVNRGVKADLVAADPEAYKIDEEVMWWSFSSTTTDISALSNPMFLGKDGARTIFQILTTRGVDIGCFSAIPSEAEVLLPAGTALKITGVLPQGDGLTIVTLEDDEDAPEMIG